MQMKNRRETGNSTNKGKIMLGVLVILLILLPIIGCQPQIVRYLVSYEVDGSIYRYQMVNSNEKATAPAVSPSKYGYAFSCWSRDGRSAFDFNSGINSDIELVALWNEKELHTVTFSYDDDGSTPDYILNVYDGDVISVPADPVRGGAWQFVRWVDENGEYFDFSSPIKRDITLTAKWNYRTLYLVEFYARKDFKEAYTISDVYDGDRVTAPLIDPTIAGATFISWTYEDGDTYDFNTPVTGPLKLYGKWKYEDRLTVTYHLYTNSDGKEVTTKRVYYRNDRLEEPADPSRYGYSFVRWVWDTPRDRAVDFNIPVVGNWNIYAEWKEKTQYTVTFDYGDSKQDPDTESVYEGNLVSQPTDPKYDKYYFVMWVGENGKEFDFDEPITRDTTIRAVWARDAVYDITFDHNNGTEDTVVRLGKGSDYRVPRPEDPQREGLDFDCWTTLDGKEFDFSSVVSSDMTLKAKWKLKPSYSIHDIGPGGGYVFYDCDADNDSGNADGLISTKCGWRYMEVARTSIGYYKFGYYRPEGGNTMVGGTSTAIGTGKSNTEKLVAAMGDEAYMDKEGDDKGSYAALSCYKKDLFNNGYDDWFLPSKDELYQLYINIHRRWNVDWGHDAFFSSSEFNQDYAWSQDFFFGYQHGYIRNVGQYILPVRQF